jgi:hypothetical protein
MNVTKFRLKVKPGLASGRHVRRSPAPPPPIARSYPPVATANDAHRAGYFDSAGTRAGSRVRWIPVGFPVGTKSRPIRIKRGASAIEKSEAFLPAASPITPTASAGAAAALWRDPLHASARGRIEWRFMQVFGPFPKVDGPWEQKNMNPNRPPRRPSSTKTAVAPGGVPKNTGSQATDAGRPVNAAPSARAPRPVPEAARRSRRTWTSRSWFR